MSDAKVKTIAVIGGGAWGTALAVAASNAGHQVVLWARDTEMVVEINQVHQNTKYLPGCDLPKNILAVSDLAEVSQCDVALLVIPTQQLRSMFAAFAPLWSRQKSVILCAKGVEQTSGMLPSEILRDIAPDQEIAALSGPSFAVDVVAGKPTAITLAASQMAQAETLCRLLASPAFRPYASSDLTGVEIGGALKNVFALCCGIAAGRDLGASAQAALLTRSFSEMVRYGVAHGASAETFNGLSGLGDLVLTCSSTLSRNYSFGYGLGSNELHIEDATLGRIPLAEGAFTATSAAQKARDIGLELPILSAVAAILESKLDIDTAIHQLLERPLKTEELL